MKNTATPFTKKERILTRLCMSFVVGNKFLLTLPKFTSNIKLDFRLVAKYFFWIIFYNLAPKLQCNMVQKPAEEKHY